MDRKCAILIWVILILLLAVSICWSADFGIASYYGAGEKLNDQVACGWDFNENLLECASWKYPLGTVLKVTCLETGKSVVVRVTDRGPAKRLGRLIDLTKYAFSQIADLRQGLIKVKVEIVKPYNQRYAGRCKMCFRHKWKYVRKYYEDEFEGVKFKNYYSPYRICIKCGRAEELEILPFSGDIIWMKLSPLKSEILKQIVKDEGDYFKLMEQAERAEEVFKESFSEKFGWERSKR